MVHRYKCKMKTIELSEENIGEKNLCDLTYSDKFMR